MTAIGMRFYSRPVPSFPSLSVRLIGALVVVAVSVSTVFVTGAVGPTSPRIAVAFQAAPCMFDVPVGHRADCGWLTVPAVRGDAGAGTLRLPVAVFPSVAANPASDPVVYLAGGPGEHALDTATLIFERTFAPFLEERDVILFDQRGAGLAEPSLRCPELSALAERNLSRHLLPVRAVEENRIATQRCRDRLAEEGVDLRAFTSAQSAADVADLRRAFGYAQWNLLGVSYGTRLAQTVLRDYPRGVRSVVLDSAFPLDADLFGGIYSGMDRAFNALFDACAAEPGCASAYPDLKTSLDVAFDSLSATPLTGTVRNPLTGESFDAVHDGGAVVETLFQGLYSASIIPLLPELITHLSKGRVGALATLRGSALANQAFISEGMQLTLQCAEEVSFTTEERLLARAAEMPYVERLLAASSGLGDEIIEVCDAWGASGASAVENEAVRSPVQVLVLAGSFDPITPPEGGRRVADALGNARFVELPSSSHAAIAGGICAQAVARAFLNNPHGDLDTSCVSDTPPIAWAEPLSAIVFEPFDDPVFNLSGVRPAGWMDQGLGVSARTALGLVSLAQQRARGLSAQEMLALIAEPLQRAIGVELREGSPLGSGSLAWEVFTAAAGGQVVVLALREGTGGVDLVFATGLGTQADDVVRHLIAPATRAFSAR